MRRMLIAGVLVAGICSVGSAATVDGTITGGEYDDVIADTPGETGYYTSVNDGGLDIDNAYAESDGASGYIGLDVTTPPVSLTGSDLSFTQTTGLMVGFYDSDTSGTAGVMLQLLFDASGLDTDQSFVHEWNGSSYDTTAYSALSSSDYDVAASSALETRIAFSVFNDYDDSNFPQYLRMQLDDNGGYADDQVVGYIPEPATMALLAIGAAGVVLRRRRQ